MSIEDGMLVFLLALAIFSVFVVGKLLWVIWTWYAGA